MDWNSLSVINIIDASKSVYCITISATTVIVLLAFRMFLGRIRRVALQIIPMPVTGLSVPIGQNSEVSLCSSEWYLVSWL
jgi:hypothetical protein